MSSVGMNDTPNDNEGILLKLLRKKDADRTYSHNGKTEVIRMPDVTLASWGRWQVIYALRRINVLSKLLDRLGGPTQ